MPDLPYYDDLTFVNANSDPDCRAVINQQFADFCAINFLESGSILFGQDERPMVRIDAPAFYWTWQEPVWHYRSAGDLPWNHHWVSFRGPRVARLRAGGLFPVAALPVARAAQAQPMLGEFVALVRLVRRADPREHADGVQRLERLLLTAMETIHREPRADGLDERLEALAREIRAEPFRDWHFPTLARAMELSYSHFRARFRETLREAPAAYLTRCRMLAIARELEQGQPVKAVAYEHGYRDLGNFSRLFSRVLGVSPRAYVSGLPYRR